MDTWKEKFDTGKRNSTTAHFLQQGAYDGSLPEFHEAVQLFLDGKVDAMVPVCALTALVLSPAWEDIRAGWPEIDWDPKEENISADESLNVFPEHGHKRADQLREFVVWAAVQDGGKNWNPVLAENEIASLVRMATQMTGGQRKDSGRIGDIAMPNLDRIFMMALYWAIELHLYDHDEKRTAEKVR